VIRANDLGALRIPAPFELEFAPLDGIQIE
jgi:hypothetical protein